jgi:hypothetical protein
VSRGVAANAAQTSGVGDGILKQMLPVVAAMVMGALTRQLTGGQQGAASGGGLGNILGSVLGGGQAQGSSGGLGDILGGMLGGGRATQGAGGGLGDILGSVLGGSQQAGQTGGIGDILNSVFGSNANAETRTEATRRAGSVLDGILGGGTQGAAAADDLVGQLTRMTK